MLPFAARPLPNGANRKLSLNTGQASTFVAKRSAVAGFPIRVKLRTIFRLVWRKHFWGETGVGMQH
jgi:hypothetical protein